MWKVAAAIALVPLAVILNLLITKKPHCGDSSEGHSAPLKTKDGSGKVIIEDPDGTKGLEVSSWEILPGVKIATVDKGPDLLLEEKVMALKEKSDLTYSNSECETPGTFVPCEGTPMFNKPDKAGFEQLKGVKKLYEEPLLPSEKPALISYIPERWQVVGLGEHDQKRWVIDVNAIEDPQAFFSRVLPNLRYFRFPEYMQEGVFLWQVFPEALWYDSRYWSGSLPCLRGALIKDNSWSPDSVKLDSAYFGCADGSFLKRFSQDPGLRPTIKTGLWPVDYRWQTIDFWRNPRDRLWWNDTIVVWPHSRLHAYDFERRRELPILDWITNFTKSKHDPWNRKIRNERLSHHWIQFERPLEALDPQGPTVYSLHTTVIPMNDRKSKGTLTTFYDPKPFNPLESWVHPKWGSRVDGTTVNDFCNSLEAWCKGLGDYIHFRVGAVPPHGGKAFYTYHFGWIRSEYEWTLFKGGSSVFDFASSLLPMFLEKLLTDIRAAIVRCVDCPCLSEIFTFVSALLEKIRDPLENFNSLYPWNVNPFAGSTASSPALFLGPWWLFLAHFAFVKPVIVWAASLAFVLLPLVFALPIAVFNLFWGLLKSLFISSVFLNLTFTSLWVALFLIVVLRRDILSFDFNKILVLFFRVEIIWQGHTHKPRPVSTEGDLWGPKERLLLIKKNYLALALPLLINIVFGMPTVLSAATQTALCLAVSPVIFVRSLYLGLCLLGFISVKRVPKNMVTTFLLVRPLMLRPSVIDSLSLFTKCPPVPHWVRQLGVITLKGLSLFVGCAMVCFSIVVFFVFLINLEGLVGPCGWCGWVSWYNAPGYVLEANFIKDLHLCNNLFR